MSARNSLLAVVAALVLAGCSLGAATRVLFMGLPDRVMPTQRKVSLSLFAGNLINPKPGSEQSRPLRLCVYVHQNEDWLPPIDLGAPCSEHGGRVLKAEQMTLVADKVGYFSTTVSYQDTVWITVTGDFSDPGNDGRPVIKLRSPSTIDSCHWARIERNQISEVNNISLGSLPSCR